MGETIFLSGQILPSRKCWSLSSGRGGVMSVLRLFPQLPAQTLHGGGFQRMVRKGGDAGGRVGGEGAKEGREGEMA